jgi:predicted nucleic acid-binding protein
MTMMDKIVALDTNILIYLHDNSNATKRSIAKELAVDIP